MNRKQLKQKAKAAIKVYKAKAAKTARIQLAAAKKKFNAAHKSANAAVRRNPEKAVLIAAALGAAIGAATAVALRRKK